MTITDRIADVPRRLTIRILNAARALDPTRRPDCAGACNEGHTYRWPCALDLHPTESIRTTTRWVVHNVIAHPLLALWPRAGWALHDATVPDAVIIDEDAATNEASEQAGPYDWTTPYPYDDTKVRTTILGAIGEGLANGLIGAPLAERLIHHYGADHPLAMPPIVAANIPGRPTPGLVDALRALTPDDDPLPVGEVYVGPAGGVPLHGFHLDGLVAAALTQATEFLHQQMTDVGLDPADYILAIDRTPLDTSLNADRDTDDLRLTEFHLGLTARRKGPAPDPADTLTGVTTAPDDPASDDLAARIEADLDRAAPGDAPSNVDPRLIGAPGMALSAAMDQALDLTEPDSDAVDVLAHLEAAGWTLYKRPDTNTVEGWGPNPPQDLGELGRWASTGWVYKADPRDLAQAITRLIDRNHRETRSLAHDLNKAERRLMAAETRDLDHLDDLAAGNVDPQDRRLAEVIATRRRDLALLELAERPTPDVADVIAATNGNADLAAIANGVAQAIAADHLGRLPAGPEGTHPLMSLAYAIDDHLRTLVPDLDRLTPKSRPQWWLAWTAEQEAMTAERRRIATSPHTPPTALDLNAPHAATGGPSTPVDKVTWGGWPEGNHQGAGMVAPRRITDRPQA